MDKILSLAFEIKSYEGEYDGRCDMCKQLNTVAKEVTITYPNEEEYRLRVICLGCYNYIRNLLKSPF